MYCHYSKYHCRQFNLQLLPKEGTDVHIFGRKPLLLNLNPVTLRRLQWYSTRARVADGGPRPKGLEMKEIAWEDHGDINGVFLNCPSQIAQVIGTI